MPPTKPPYPPELRREAVQLAESPERSITQLARDLGVSNRRELQSAVFDYIESFYNRERRHSTLGYFSPREFEMISIDKREDQDSKP